MRTLEIAALLLFTAAGAAAQNQPAPNLPAQDQTTPDQVSTLSVHSNLVIVPALVKTKGGAVVYTLKASDFLVTDDGVPQKLTLEEDTDHQPLALVIAVETGASGVPYLDDYRDLGTMIEAVVGDVPHRIALVAFDSGQRVAQPFTSSIDRVTDVMGRLDEGDNKAAILDALQYSVNLLKKQPPTYRRAILLLSETVDQGSHIHLEDALRSISDTNTAIYSLAYSTTKNEVLHEASKLSSDDPGPNKGCFSRDPNDPNVDLSVSRGTQTFDCLAMLAPPLRLAKMAAIATMRSLRRNTPETVAHLTGGEYYSFKNRKTLEKSLLTISNHVPNRYVLSFQPQSPHPGPHVLTVTLPNHINLTVEARTSYWIDEDQQ